MHAVVCRTGKTNSTLRFLLSLAWLCGNAGTLIQAPAWLGWIAVLLGGIPMVVSAWKA